jgi:hypothetical protein
MRSLSAANSAFPNGGRPGVMNTTSSVIISMSAARSRLLLAAIQAATSSRIWRTSSLMLASFASTELNTTALNL